MAIGGNRVLFVEGTSETCRADLKEGFAKLLNQKLKGKMPKINMGDSLNNTLKKFRNYDKGEAFTLIDLDGRQEIRDIRIDGYKKEFESMDCTCIYFMIQEMESWFLSQPDILDKYYGVNISEKIPQKNVSEIDKPDERLHEWTKQTKRGAHDKVRHGVDLLKRLDADKLQQYFSDFDRLIQKLSEN